jgi:hypothetical protein
MFPIGKCEGMNPHTPKATPTLGDRVPVDSQWTPDGLLNLHKAISGVKSQWIEKFFISLESSWNLDV